MPINTTPTSGNESRDLLSYSHMFVRLYSRLNSGQIVTGSLDPAGTCLLIQLIERDCRVWEGRYDSLQVYSLKQKCSPELSWQCFFELLQRTFAEHLIEWDDAKYLLKATIKHDRQSDSLPLPPFVENIALPLEATSIEDFPKKMTESMMSFVMLRTGDRKEMDRVVDVIRIESSLQQETQRCSEELSYLTLSNQRLEALVDQYKHSHDRLEKALSQSKSSEVAAGWRTALTPSNIERALCRVPNPLRTAEGLRPRTVNMDLLRALKSDAMPPNATSSTLYRANAVIHPCSPEDKAAFVDRLPQHARAVHQLIIGGLDTWDFDVATLDEAARASGGSALIYLGFTILWRHNLPNALNLSEEKLISWLELVSAGYASSTEEATSHVAFHTELHAADVLHALNFFVSQQDGVQRMHITDPLLLGAFIAAMAHDFNHHGLNNIYHINAQTPLAQVYADQSPTENFHIAQLFELMKLPQYDLLDCCPPTTRDDIQRTIIEMVLATDMKRHPFYMAAFEAKLAEMKYTRHSDVLMLLCMLLKAADVSNCAKPPDAYQRWATGIMKEYSFQSQLEAEAHVNSTQALMKAEAVDAERAKGQLSFINMVVLPLFAAIGEAVPTLRGVCGQHLADNRKYWAEKLRSG